MWIIEPQKKEPEIFFALERVGKYCPILAYIMEDSRYH